MTINERNNTIIPIGPYHPLQEEPEFFKLHVDGEKVVGIDIEIGYNHRGIEKLSESKNYDQSIFLVERICGICSTSHPLAFVTAMENLATITIPDRAKYIRSFLGEMERIHSHLLWLGLAGHFIGYNTVWMWAWKYREPVLDVFEKVTGNRQHYAMMKIGGVRRDIHLEDIPWIRTTLNDLRVHIEMLRDVVIDDPVLHARLKGIGVLSKQDVIDYCATGPLARASGLDIDVRRDAPYAAYPMLDFKVITASEGDIYAKAVVRVLEVLESINISLQCLDWLEKNHGDIAVNVKDIPVGEGIGRHEAPRGECFHYVKSDHTTRPVRHKVRAPSFVNVATNAKAVLGYHISDALIVLGAVDPCYCCAERLAIVDATNGKPALSYHDLLKLSHEKTNAVRKNL